MTRTYAAYDISEFQMRVLLRLGQIMQDTGKSQFRMPNGPIANRA